MKNLLTKTLFISLLSLAAIPSVTQELLPFSLGEAERQAALEGLRVMAREFTNVTTGLALKILEVVLLKKEGTADKTRTLAAIKLGKKAVKALRYMGLQNLKALNYEFCTYSNQQRGTFFPVSLVSMEHFFEGRIFWWLSRIRFLVNA